MSLKTGISRGMGGSNQKRPSVGAVWIFSGTTHFNNDLIIIIIIIIIKIIIVIIIISLYGNTDKIAEIVSLPSVLTQCCLEGLRFHQGNFGGKARLIRGRGGKICCGKWFLRSKFSFIPKCFNSFV